MCFNQDIRLLSAKRPRERMSICAITLADSRWDFVKQRQNETYREHLLFNDALQPCFIAWDGRVELIVRFRDASGLLEADLWE